MMTRRTLLRSLPAAAVLPYALRAAPASPRHKLQIGTGTGHSSSKGTYVEDWSIDREGGQIFLAAELDSPTFLALDRRARWLLVNGLGSDRIWIYRMASNGILTPGKQTFWQGRFKSGRRHLIFHRNKRWVYNVNELNWAVDHLIWNSKEGTLTNHGTPISTLPDGYPARTSSASEIVASPNGRFI